MFPKEEMLVGRSKSVLTYEFLIIYFTGKTKVNIGENVIEEWAYKMWRRKI